MTGTTRCCPHPSQTHSHTFARVQLNGWLATNPHDDRQPRHGPYWGEHGSAMLSISAFFTYMLLEVLPGHEREFRSFVAKVIWASGGGADVGVQGVVAVKCGWRDCRSKVCTC
jgi:hypothetical protein